MVVGDEAALHPVLSERGPVVVTEAGSAVGGGHVAETGAPKTERVEQRLAQDDFATGQGVLVPDTAVRPRQVKVGGLAGSGVPVELAAVHLDHPSGAVEDGDDGTTVEVLVARGPEHPEALQPPPQFGTFLSLLGR